MTGMSRSPRPDSLAHTPWLRVENYEAVDVANLDWSRAFLVFSSFLQAPLLDSTEAEIREQISANLTVQILVARKLLHSIKNDFTSRRDIVFIGSTSAYTGFAGSSSYCASKFGLRGFVESLNAEYAGSNIRFWLASMGSMNNEMGRRVPNVKQEHLLSPIEVARDIVHAVVRDTSAFQPEIVIRRRWTS